MTLPRSMSYYHDDGNSIKIMTFRWCFRRTRILLYKKLPLIYAHIRIDISSGAARAQLVFKTVLHFFSFFVSFFAD